MKKSRKFLLHFNEKLNSIAGKFKHKLMDIRINDMVGKHRVFKHWKAISQGIYVDNMDDMYFNFESKIINAIKINDYDKQSMSILSYIIHELTSLLNYNENTYIKTNITHFIIEFIDRIFYRYNNENITNTSDMLRFKYIIHSVSFIKEMEESNQNITEGMYEEMVDMDENSTDITQDENNFDVDDEDDETYDVDMTEEDIDNRAGSMHDKMYSFAGPEYVWDDR